jgi:hypothetical protein
MSKLGIAGLHTGEIRERRQFPNACMWRSDYQGQTKLSRLNPSPLVLNVAQVISEENHKGTVTGGNPGVAPYAN